MKLSRLERAPDYDVVKWLDKKLNLTAYQKDKLSQEEIMRWSPFYFYKLPERKKVSILWRLTLPIFPIYLLLVVIFNPIKWMFTGKWGYGRNFIDNFHNKWVRKLGL